MQVQSCWCWDPMGPRSAEGTRSLGTYACSWCQTFKIFRKVQMQIANRSITRARLLVFFAGGCKTLQGRRSGCCLRSNTRACTCSENGACEPAVFFCRCRHLTTSHLIASSGEQSQLPFIFLRALVLTAVGNKTTCAQVPDRKWVRNCFALNRNYNDLPSWGWLSQANTLALTLESEFVPERFPRWLQKIWHSSGNDAAFLLVTCLLCISPWCWCSGQILAVVWADEMSPWLCPCWSGNEFSVLQAGSVSWFLALAHPCCCCGCCCVQAPKPLAVEVSGFSSWCPGV